MKTAKSSGGGEKFARPGFPVQKFSRQINLYLSKLGKAISVPDAPAILLMSLFKFATSQRSPAVAAIQSKLTKPLPVNLKCHVRYPIR